MTLETDISTTIRKAREHRHAYRLTAFPGSPAFRELREVEDDPVHREMLETTYSTAMLLVIASEDALESLEALLQAEELHAFSVAVLSRSVLEWCATARWLLPETGDVRRRVARGITNYLDGLWRQHQMVVGGDDSLRQRIESRILQEVEEAEEQGYAVVRGKGQRYFVESPRPSATELVADLFASYERVSNRDEPGQRMGSLLYRYYSGIAHGAPLSLLEFFERPSEAGARFAMKNPKRLDIERPAALAILGFLEGFARVVEIYGWDEHYWKGWRREVAPRCFDRIVPNKAATP